MDRSACHAPRSRVAGVSAPARRDAADFLDPEDAFKFSAAISDDGSAVEARFSIADGYYLYRERFGFAAGDGAQLGVPRYPTGEIKVDETFNRRLEIYRGDVVVKLPVLGRQRPVHANRQSYRAAPTRGVCYPPEMRTAQLDPAAASSWATATASASACPRAVARRRHQRTRDVSKAR